MSLSEEQQIICEYILERKNVRCVAKAGTGKTTTAFEIAKKFYEKYCLKSLLLTYNAKLKEETRIKITKGEISHVIESDNYHSFACKYTKGVNDDTKLNKFIEEKDIILDYGLIIIDEAQDMKEIYCNLVLKIIKSCKNPPVMLIMGDPFQSLYEKILWVDDKISPYLNSEDFFSEYLFDKKFYELHLSISYRISHEMADWINKNLNPNSLKKVKPYSEQWHKYGDRISSLWGEGIKANPKRPQCVNSVTYMDCSWINDSQIDLTRELFKKYSWQDTAILATTVKGDNTPASNLTKSISEEVWISVDKETKKEEKNMTNKRVFSTIHQYKGLERKCIFLCGMNGYYENKFDSKNIMDLFNEYYVACTRATEKLVIFTCKTKYDYFATMRENEVENSKVAQTLNITKLLEFVTFDKVISNCFETKEMENVEDSKKFNLSDISYTKGSNYYENISAFIGTSVGFRVAENYNQFKFNSNFREDIFSSDNCKNVDILKWYRGKCKKEISKDIDKKWALFLRLAIAEESAINNRCYLWRQITKKMISKFIKHNVNYLEDCFLNTKKIIESFEPQKIECEFPISLEWKFPWFVKKNYNRIITGRCDIILDGKILIELKTSDSILNTDHILQVLAYESILNIKDKTIQKSYIFYTNKYRLFDCLLKVDYFEFLDRLISRKCKREVTSQIIKEDKKIFYNFEEKLKFIFDLETIGFPRKNEGGDPRNFTPYDTARVVQIGYILIDNKNKEVKRFCCLIKPDNFRIMNSHIHKITQINAEINGIKMIEALKLIYEDLKKCEIIISHNLHFDYNVLASECYRYNLHHIGDELKNKKQYCTMQNGKTKLGLSKIPNLVKLFSLLYEGKERPHKHDALDDSECCMFCYIKLV